MVAFAIGSLGVWEIKNAILQNSKTPNSESNSGDVLALKFFAGGCRAARIF